VDREADAKIVEYYCRETDTLEIMWPLGSMSLCRRGRLKGL